VNCNHPEEPVSHSAPTTSKGGGVSRRNFLKATLMAVAGTLSSTVSTAQEASERLIIDELSDVVDRTEVPIAELVKWGEKDVSCRFVVINDIHLRPDGPTGECETIMLRLKEQRPDFIVFNGDLQYGQGKSQQVLLDAFGLLKRLAQKAEVPCYFGMGNTDMLGGNDPAQPFRTAFNTEPYYSFDAGGVHFVMLYTEKTVPDRYGIIADPELAWLKTDLDAMPRGKPVILFGHHALYVDAKWGSDSWGVENSRELFELLEPYHLIATFSAHRHLNRMDIGPRGALHVINGAMMGDHSDNVGRKNDGIGYRWVSITNRQIATTWVRVGFRDLAPGF